MKKSRIVIEVEYSDYQKMEDGLHPVTEEMMVGDALNVARGFCEDLRKVEVNGKVVFER